MVCHPAARWLLALLAFPLLAGEAAAGGWRLTRIAQTGDPGIADVVGVVRELSLPAINQAGEVAFAATMYLPAPGSDFEQRTIVFAGDETGLTAMRHPVTQVPLHSSSHPDLNDKGQVCLVEVEYQDSLPVRRVWRATDAALELIADESHFDGITDFARINDAGRVAFASRGSSRNGVYTADGSEDSVEDYGVVIEDVTSAPLPFFGSWLDINDAGNVVFDRSEVVEIEGVRMGRTELLVSGEAGVSLVATRGSQPSDQDGYLDHPANFAMDARGRVAFFTIILDLPVAGLFLFDGSEIRTLVEATPDSEDLPDGHLALNDLGELAYGAFALEDGDNTDDQTVYVAGEVVLRSGDSLDGRTVREAEFLPTALNDARQLALHVWFEGGVQAIYRAGPIPTVPSFSATGGGLLFAALGAVAIVVLRAAARRSTY